MQPPMKNALLSLAVVPALFAGCGGGDGLPGDSVARVGDQPIARAQFAHWFDVATRSQSADGGAASLPDPPTYAKCVAAARTSLSKFPAGRKPVSDQELKQGCERRHRMTREQVMQFLISAQWIEQEAAEQGIQVTDAAVDVELASSRQRSFPKPAEYRKFLERSGMRGDDARFRVKIALLSSELKKRVKRGVERATDEDAAAYYSEHRDIFTQGEGRTLRIVRTEHRAAAERARDALSSGRSWEAVARRYSNDRATMNSGGLMVLIEGNHRDERVDGAVRKAVFSASRGEIEGPLKASTGHYVFEVTKISPPSHKSLDEAKANIKRFLTLTRQKQATDGFFRELGRKWKARTDCSAGFVVQDCSNAPRATEPQGTTPPSSSN